MLRAIARAVNRIVKDGYVTVDGRDIPVELFLGGNYKVLKLITKIRSPSCPQKVQLAIKHMHVK